MIALPDFNRTFDYENGFYLSCDASRMRKILIHYELYKMTLQVQGAMVECGVFKGASLARFVMFRSLLENGSSRRIIGFDTFGAFPETDYEPDKAIRQEFIEEAGGESISVEQMTSVLQRKGCNNGVELVKGDICETVAQYLREHPQLKVSLLNLDTDLYEPAKVILEHFWPRIQKGGILILDDYGVFPGETRAVDEYFRDKSVLIRRFDFSSAPCYIVKE